MNDEIHDCDLIRLYRKAAQECSAAVTDARILQAARQHARRTRLLSCWRIASIAAAAVLLLMLNHGANEVQQLAQTQAAPIAAQTPTTRYLLRAGVPIEGSSEVTAYLLNQDVRAQENDAAETRAP